MEQETSGRCFSALHKLVDTRASGFLTFDLRFRHGMHALDIHLLFADFGSSGTTSRLDEESVPSSLGLIVRIVLCNMWRMVRPWNHRGQSWGGEQ